MWRQARISESANGQFIAASTTWPSAFMDFTGGKRENRAGVRPHRRDFSCALASIGSGRKTKQAALFCLALACMVAGTGCQTVGPGSKRVGHRPKGADAVLGRTTLHSAPNWTVAERLVREGADVNARDSFGMTPLHTAVRAGRNDVAEVLMTHGADVNARSDRGQTPLFFWAVTGEGKQMAEHLIAHGADVNARDNYGMTPLHCAAAAGHEGAVQVLLAAGADIDIKDNEGRSPLDWARNLGHTEIAELLVQQGARNNAETETSTRGPTDN